MLNCWCITWPVGFKRLKVQAFTQIMRVSGWGSCKYLLLTIPIMSSSLQDVVSLRVEPLQVTTNASWWHMTSGERLPGTSSCSTQRCFTATSFWMHPTLRQTSPFWLRTCSRSSNHGTTLLPSYSIIWGGKVRQYSSPNCSSVRLFQAEIYTWDRSSRVTNAFLKFRLKISRNYIKL